MARGSITKRRLKAKKNGREEIRYSIRYDVGVRWKESEGVYERVQRSETIPPPNTRKHAEMILAERLSQINKDEFIEPSRMYFRDFALKWVENYAMGQVKTGTVEDYKGYFRNHLFPAFGEKSLSTIRVEDIEAFKSAKLNAGYKPQTVIHLLKLLRQMLNHAVDWGYLRINPAKKVKNPKKESVEMDCLRPDEARRFLCEVSVKWYSFFFTAIATGLRMGELLAMRWENLDWVNSRYYVRENLSRARYGYKGGFTSPKTEQSKAGVALTPACLEVLRSHERRQKTQRLALGQEYKDQDLVFCTYCGGPLDEKNVINRQFKPALKSAGLRSIRFHDLRHTTASILINQGVSPKSIQRQMRHASIETTFDTYGHLFPETHAAAIEKIDSALLVGIAADKSKAEGRK